MTGIAPFDLELPYVLSVDQAASHLTTTATLTKVPVPRGDNTYGLVLVDSEILAISAFTAHYLTIHDTGLFGTTAVTHAATAHVYEVVSIRQMEDGLLVGFVGSDGTIAYKHIVTGGSLQPLPETGDPGSVLFVDTDGTLEFDVPVLNFPAPGLPADLTDSTAGVASVTNPPTLIAIRVDTAAHVAADTATNFATLYAFCKKLNDALAAATVIADD